MNKLTHHFLKDKQRKERSTHHPNLALRVHRALSWLKKAEECEDIDGRFIFLWISFNAAYAQELGKQAPTPTKQVFREFLDKLLGLDEKNLLYELVWSEFPSSIKMLLANKFVFQPYWDFENDIIQEIIWQDSFNKAKTIANKALGIHDTLTVIGLVLDRLYTLRNQLIHGGATWNSKINRRQLTDGTNFLKKLVPVIILLMLENCDGIWGEPCYPVTEGSS